MSYQRWINDDSGNQVEIDPATNQPTEGQAQSNIQPGSDVQDLAEQRPTDPEWVQEAEDWAEKNWYDQG